MSAVQINDVVKRYGALEVVHGINLSIQPQEFVVLVGPSGCGKSTTLRMLAGLEDISDGTVSMDGRVVNKVAPKDRDVAMVFQNYALYPHMSVERNMSFALRLARRPKAEIAAKVQAVAQILNIAHLLERKPKELSGGQRQRVAIGRSIIREPEVFLFDEPLSNLDAKLRGHMRAELAALHAQLGKTTVYVTHDQVEAMTLATRIVVFHKGEIQQAAAPSEIFNRPANLFVAGFIGMPTMNFFNSHFRLEKGRALLQGNGFSWPAPPWLDTSITRDGQALVLGLRPQHLRPANGESSLTLKILANSVEYLGTESQVAGQLDAAEGQRVTAMVPGNAQSLRQRTFSLQFDIDDLHVFDAETGASLRA